MIIRQGDVMLVKVAALPKGAEEENLSRAERVVLAYGEVTGHAHAIERDPETRAMPVRAWNAGAERFIQVISRAALKHEEHATIALETGIYRVVRQREYAPQEIRQTRRVED